VPGQYHKVSLPPEVCYVSFTDGKSDRSVELPYETARGEMLIADLDADGKLVGIELVAPSRQKPCQGS
jgi:uncharacterized protein YuzE